MYKVKKYWENEYVNHFSIPSTEVNTIFLSFATSDVTQKRKLYLVHESYEKNPQENWAFSELFTRVSVFKHWILKDFLRPLKFQHDHLFWLMPVFSQALYK